MKKLPNPYLLIGEIVLILAIVGSLSYFIWKFFDKRQDKKDTEGAGDLAKDTVAGKDSEFLSKDKAIKDKQIEAAKKMDVIKIGDLIYSAKSFYNDDEQAVYSAFALIPNKFALQLFLDYWKGVYKSDLFTFLRSFLDDEELNKINNIVAKLK